MTIQKPMAIHGHDPYPNRVQGLGHIRFMTSHFREAKCIVIERKGLAMATLQASLFHGHQFPATIVRQQPARPSPFSGLVRCVFSAQNGRLQARPSRRTIDVSVQSSSSSQSTEPPPGNAWEGFNPDDYEQKEETEEEARERNWKERGYAFSEFSQLDRKF